MKECTVKKVGTSAIEIHFSKRGIELVQQIGNNTVFIKFKTPKAFITPPGKRVFEKGRK